MANKSFENYRRRNAKDGFPGGSVVRSLPANLGDMGLIPHLGRSYMMWNSEACVPQLLNLCSRAWELQLLSHMQ